MSPWSGSVMALFLRPRLLLHSTPASDFLHPSVALRDDPGSVTDGLLLVAKALMPHNGDQAVEAMSARPRGSTAPRVRPPPRGSTLPTSYLFCLLGVHARALALKACRYHQGLAGVPEGYPTSVPAPG